MARRSDIDRHDDPRPARPVVDLPADGSSRHSAVEHLCLIFDGAAEQESALGPFLARGLAMGERCLLFVPASLRRRAVRALRRQGVAPQPELDRGALVLAAPAPLTRALAQGEAGAAGDAGNRGTFADRLALEYRQALAGGFSGLRVSWEVPSHGIRLEYLVALEAALGQLHADSRISLLCQYARGSDPFVLLQVLRTHPRVILGGEAGPNCFYEPPEIVLGAGGANGASAEVDWILGELKRAQRGERQLLEMNRCLAEKGRALESVDRSHEELLAKLAHELRNPLGTVSNAIQVLRLRDGDEELRGRALAAAERQIVQQARLVDELLEGSQIVHGELELRRERFDLAPLVTETVESFRQSLGPGGPQVELLLPAAPLPIHGDRRRLGHALSHLLANAVKFGAARGRRAGVTVRAAALADGRAEITVADRGPGIRSDLLPHVFEIFTQETQSLDRASGGLGMGLAIVKGLIELHGGEVQARNRRHAGAEIKVLLPLAPVVANANAPRRDGEVHRVLVVEDNADAAMTMRDFLELSGFEVAVAGTGGEGVAEARRFRPEVVLCDLGLPGMNGFEVAVALRRDPATASMRLIAVTGYGRDEDRRRSREAGFDLHLTKPVDPAELRRLLHEPAAARAPHAATLTS